VGPALFQKFAETPEILFFCQPEALVEVLPGFCGVMPEQVS